MTYHSTFIHLLKRIRQKKYFTQPDFAYKFGIAVNTYKNWERGICFPSFKKFYKLLRAMDSSKIYSSTDISVLQEAYDKALLAKYNPDMEKDISPGKTQRDDTQKVRIFR